MNLSEEHRRFLSFVIFKGFWAAAIASLITPIIGWWALANASQKY